MKGFSFLLLRIIANMWDGYVMFSPIFHQLLKDMHRKNAQADIIITN